MSGVNKVLVIGNVGRDPEIRYMPSGGAVANLSIATSETWKDKDTGEKKEKTEWHRCVVFGKGAEIVEKYVKKGSKLFIEGSLQTREWEKEGQKHYTTEIKVRDFQMLDSKGSAGGDSSASQEDPGPLPQDDFDDGIPF